MNEQERVWSVRRTAAVLSESVNNAEGVADVNSAILDFLIAMHAGDFVVGGDDFAALLDAALAGRGKTRRPTPSDSKLSADLVALV